MIGSGTKLPNSCGLLKVLVVAVVMVAAFVPLGHSMVLRDRNPSTNNISSGSRNNKLPLEQLGSTASSNTGESALDIEAGSTSMKLEEEEERGMFPSSSSISLPGLDRRQMMTGATLGGGAMIVGLASLEELLLSPGASTMLQKPSFATSSPLSPEAMATLQEGDTIVRNLWLGRLTYPTLIVALESNFFEALKHGPKTKKELGQVMTPKLDAHSRPLEAILSVMSSLGLVNINSYNGKDDSSSSISLTEAASLVMLKESPYYWGHQLLASDGVTATLRKRMKQESLEYKPRKATAYENHSSQMLDGFIDSMQAHSAVTAEATALALKDILSNSSDDASSSFHLLDMAGGSGCFSKALIRAIPNLKVTLADLPPVIAKYRSSKSQNYYREKQRIEAVPADLFEAQTWPIGPNVVLLANVLHDWGETQVKDILTTTYSVLSQERRGEADIPGRLVIVEQLLENDKSGPLPAALASVSMLLGDWRTGREYTFQELETYLKEAGYTTVKKSQMVGNFHHLIIATV